MNVKYWKSDGYKSHGDKSVIYEFSLQNQQDKFLLQGLSVTIGTKDNAFLRTIGGGRRFIEEEERINI